jgi:hypothetical protein
VFGKVAALLFIAGAAISVVLLAINIATGEPTTRTRSGWFLLSAILGLSSLQVLLTGIIAEVLARVFYRTGSAESFVVRREWSAETTTTNPPHDAESASWGPRHR